MTPGRESDNARERRPVNTPVHSLTGIGNSVLSRSETPDTPNTLVLSCMPALPVRSSATSRGSPADSSGSDVNALIGRVVGQSLDAEPARLKWTVGEMREWTSETDY
jgi:hypothetical protein